MLKSLSKRIIFVSVGLLCVADLVLIYIFGKQIPGYSHLSCTISSLGESSCPVSVKVIIWSVILGIIFILFGFSFSQVIFSNGKETNIAYQLIILYGFGENIVSGIIKSDIINGVLSLTAIVHNLLGGMGVAAMLLFPLILMKVFTGKSFPGFYLFSVIVFAIGLISISFFMIRVFNSETAFFNSFKGLWQRIFLVDFYIYYIALAVVMIRKTNERLMITK
jgi:hypothetical protein